MALHAMRVAAQQGARQRMKVGYARVSTEDQSLDAQRDQLRADGCSEIFEEKITSKKDRRPALDQALALLQPGDTLVVWKLDRLGRSVKHLTTLLHDLERRGVCFRSISDGIDTGTPTGKLLFHVLGAIAEFEAALVSERIKIGLQAAKQRGKQLGRPRRLEAHQVRQAEMLRTRENLTYEDIATQLKVGRTTLWRAGIR
ncbi:Site-specific DNA recombinase [Nitrosomonas eutropha]|uniref:Site-specific DNA recombinase n=2 Tax=Nitrosomonas eutropha TaxID=916 RepID=A0A1I7F4H3_9PROT|nr:Site-specific DNA recombinase [Nitrosomonas eutropha]